MEGRYLRKDSVAFLEMRDAGADVVDFAGGVYAEDVGVGLEHYAVGLDFPCV